MVDRLKPACLLIEAHYDENDIYIVTDFSTDFDNSLIYDDPVSACDAQPGLEFDKHIDNSLDSAAPRDAQPRIVNRNCFGQKNVPPRRFSDFYACE